jgi:hypothetical protein
MYFEDFKYCPLAAALNLKAQGTATASRSLSAMDGAEAAHMDVFTAVLEAVAVH